MSRPKPSYPDVSNFNCDPRRRPKPTANYPCKTIPNIPCQPTPNIPCNLIFSTRTSNCSAQPAVEPSKKRVLRKCTCKKDAVVGSSKHGVSETASALRSRQTGHPTKDLFQGNPTSSGENENEINMCLMQPECGSNEKDDTTNSRLDGGIHFR